MITLRQVYDGLGAGIAPTPTVAMLQEACAGFPGVENTASGVRHPATKAHIMWIGSSRQGVYVNKYGNETQGLNLSDLLKRFAKQIKDFNEMEATVIRLGLEAIARNMVRLSGRGGPSLRVSPGGQIYFATGPNSNVVCSVMDVVSHLTQGLT